MRKASITTTFLVAAVLLVGSDSVEGASITLTAVISDRGTDGFPRDGVFESVFGNDSVTQITSPALGDPASEERTAIEFLLGATLTGGTIDSVTLLLSPQSGMNLGLSSTENAEIHGYGGDGVISGSDLMVSNLVGSFAGPTPNGQVGVTILTTWLQGLVDSSSPYAGLMFKGDGATPVLFNFAGTFSGIPVANRPTLNIEYHTPGDMQPVPEPSTIALLGTGVAALVARHRRQKNRT